MSAATDTAAVTQRQQTRKSTFNVERLLFGVLGVATFLLIWETIARLGWVPDVLISSPTSVFEVAADDIESGLLWKHLVSTASIWTIGFLVAFVIGVPLGIGIGWFHRFALVANPTLNVFYALPALALVPLFIVWFGIGLTFKLVMVVSSTVFYLAVNAAAGVKAQERRFIEVGEVYGASRLTLFRTLILPGSVPYILAGARQAASRALVAVVVAEFIASNEGIGYLISISGVTMRTSRLMLGLVILALMGILSGEILRRMERRFDKWRLSDGDLA